MILLAAVAGVFAAAGVVRRAVAPDPIALWEEQGPESDDVSGDEPELLPSDALQQDPLEAAAVTATSSGPEVFFASRDGSQVFRVPRPGDEDYADYLEMLAHPRFASAFQNSPGYALPYDPEWRSEVTGRRIVQATEARLDGGEESMQELARAFLRALANADEESALRLRISWEEFESILWPEFPQSRPYLRALPGDAWTLHRSTSLQGVHEALRRHGGKVLELVEVRHGTRMDYTNFTLYRNVVIRVRAPGTRQVFDLAYIPAVVGCGGRYKAYIYEAS